MTIHLTIAEGEESGRGFVFDEGPLVFGRASGCDVILPDTGISRRHARIFREGDQWFVEDLGSLNGTQVNGTPVTRHRLSDGDELMLGPVVFAVSWAENRRHAGERTRLVASDRLDRLPGGGGARGRSPVHGAGAGLPGLEAVPTAARLRGAKRRRRKASRMQRRALWIGGAALALLVVGLLVFRALDERRSAPDHPEPVTLDRTPIPDSFGSGPDVQWQRPDLKAFEFPLHAPVRAIVVLHFQARDISQGEVVVTVNGTDVGLVPADTTRSAERSHELIVPPHALKRGQLNQVVFDNTRNPPGRDAWQLWNVWLETALLPELPPEQLLAEAKLSFTRAERAFEARDVGAVNRYEAWREYRNAWLMLEAHPEPKPELYRLARARVKEAQLELDRTCARLLLEVQRQLNVADLAGARATLDFVSAYFPGTDQACNLRAEQLRAAHGL